MTGRAAALVGSAYARVFARKAGWAQSLNHRLYHLALRGMGYNNGWRLEDSGEAWFVEHVLAPTSPRICLDVGANAGEYSWLLHEQTRATVYAFEPIPGPELKAKTGPRLRYSAVAVGAEHGTATLYHGVNSEHATLSLEALAIPYVAESNLAADEVTVVTLDDWVHYSLLPHQHGEIDFIKIDVEGYEVEVLLGAQELIKDHRPTFVQVEWNLHQLMRGHTLRGLAELLPGYTCWQMLPRGLRRVDVNLPETNTFCYSNFVFMSENVEI